MAEKEELALIPTSVFEDEPHNRRKEQDTDKEERDDDEETPSTGSMTDSCSTASSSFEMNDAFPIPPSRLQRIARDYPRCTLLLRRILLPFSLLLTVSFIGGAFLSLLESSNELAHNDAIASQYLQQKLHLDDIANLDSLNACIDNFKLVEEDNLFKDEINPLLLYQEHVRNCTTEFQTMQQERMQLELTPVFQSQAKEQMRFDWTTCDFSSFQSEWNEQYSESILSMRSYTSTETTKSTVSLQEAQQLAIQRATGAEVCRRDFGKATQLWFRFATTIGIQKVTTVTSSGSRALLYTLGSLSIIMCLLFVFQAGLVVRQCLIVLPRRMKQQSVYYSLILFGSIFWVLVATYASWCSRPTNTNSYSDSFWVAYGTLTTLGGNEEDEGSSGFGVLLASSFVIFLGLAVLGNIYSICWESFWRKFGNRSFR